MHMKSAAYALGVEAGYKQGVGLPDRIFHKIASRTGFPAGKIKEAFEKAAINWGALLMGGAAGAGAYQIGKKLLGPGQATNPVQIDPRHQQMVEGTQYNQGVSRDLQAAQGSFGPAANPMGKAGSFGQHAMSALKGSPVGGIFNHSKSPKKKAEGAVSSESQNKIAGFWGTAAGGLAGGLVGGIPGAIGGAALGNSIGNAVGGTGQVKNPISLDPYHRRLVNTTMYNQGLSRDLQAARGAFAPAANPFGNS